MSYKDVMNVILPPTAGKSAHITGHYGERRDSGPHGGSDFNYVGGQAGINLTHPAVHSPVAGEVVFVGGNYGTVTIRDADGNQHQILHTATQTVRVHQRVEAGDQIGTMGGTGPHGRNHYAQHVHYQMKDRNGHAMNPEAFWDARTPDHPRVAPRTGEPSESVLRHGQAGETVRNLQQTLDRLGYRDPHGHLLKPDGDFGRNTEHAVRAFQQAHGLHVDGVVGRDTREALLKAERTPLLSEQTHPSHPLFEQARHGLQQLPAGTFRNAQALDNTAGALVQQAREAGVARIDHVMLNTRGDGVIAVQGNPQDPARHLAFVDRAQAAAQPLERSTELLTAHDTHRLQSAQIQTQLQHQEHRSGLAMAMRP